MSTDPLAETNYSLLNRLIAEVTDECVLWPKTQEVGVAPVSDPLIEWTLERDVLRSDVRPHRLKSPDDSAVWLEAHEADQFERAKAITAAWAAGEAPPADDLPEGVHRIDADTLVARGIDIPEGWDFYGPAESLEASEDESRPWWDWRDREADVRTGHVVYVVRRRPTPPPPAVERVPWWEAMTQELPIAEWGGQRIKHAKLQNSGMFLSTWGLYNVIRVDAADGTVEVLRQDGAA